MLIKQYLSHMVSFLDILLLMVCPFREIVNVYQVVLWSLRQQEAKWVMQFFVSIMMTDGSLTQIFLKNKQRIV